MRAGVSALCPAQPQHAGSVQVPGYEVYSHLCAGLFGGGRKWCSCSAVPRRWLTSELKMPPNQQVPMGFTTVGSNPSPKPKKWHRTFGCTGGRPTMPSCASRRNSCTAPSADYAPGSSALRFARRHERNGNHLTRSCIQLQQHDAGPPPRPKDARTVRVWSICPGDTPWRRRSSLLERR